MSMVKLGNLTKQASLTSTFLIGYFLRLIEEYIISLDPRPQPQTHRASAY